MAIRVAIKHKTTYHYDRPVSLSPHIFRLRPAVHSRTPIEAYSFKITPKDHFINWQQDPFGNYQARVVFPEKTPLNFQLTASDTPMNSFWIPQLGGQIYAMGGMPTTTHLIADGIGEYRGSNAEISGEGFAGMQFTAKSVSENNFASWVSQVQQTPDALDLQSFNVLAKPSEDNKVAFYSSTQDDLFTTIVMKYMAHPKTPMDMQKMPGT